MAFGDVVYNPDGSINIEETIKSTGSGGFELPKDDKPTTVSPSNPFTTVDGRTVRRGPIGVGDTYRAKYTNQRLSQSNQMAAAVEGGFEYVSPQYFEDDLSNFATLGGEAMTQVQYALHQAGLLKKFQKGRWTDVEEGAMAKVLAYANRRGLLWEDALSEYASIAEEVGGDGGGRMFTARLSNPDDLKKVFTQALYDAQGGRFIDDTQMQQMVDAYQQREYAAQRAAFDNAASVEEAPAPDTFAAEQAKAMDPAGVQAAKFSDYAQIFSDLVSE